MPHDIDLPPPTEDDLRAIETPLPGGDSFADALLALLRARRDPAQRTLLEQIAAHRAAAEAIRAGETRGSGPRDADYHRWRVDRLLLDLMPRLPERIVLDHRTGGEVVAARRRVDGQFAALLLTVRTGDASPVFREETFDLAHERPAVENPVAVAPGATTHLLLRLENLPGDVLSVPLAFREDGASAVARFATVTLDVPPMGNLALALRDAAGEEVAALVRLEAKATGRLWEPSGAIDLTEQLNRVTRLPIYGPGRGYQVWMPGPFQGVYWAIDGGSETALPAGEWEMTIWRGLEHIPVRRTITVRPGAWTRQRVVLKRWTDQPARGWLSSDDHIHARLLGSEDARRLMAFVRAQDIHVANVLEMGDERRTWYPQRGFGPAFRVRDGRHWLVPGQEDPRSAIGHAIGLNLRERVRDLSRYYLNDWIAGEIHRQGGLYGHTHVGENACFAHRQMALFTPMGIVDFVSILQNRLGLDLWYDFLDMGFPLTASAGSDTPYGGTPGSVRVYGHCGRGAATTPDTFFDALRRGRTFVTNGPMCDFTVDGALPGARLAPSKGRRVATALARVREGTVRVRIVRFGKTLAEASGRGEASVSLALPAGTTGWIAAHATASDRSEAHTTPVYIAPPGGRFWNPARAEELLERQREVLREIAAEVRAAEAAWAADPNPLDHYRLRIVQSAPALRRRIARADDAYGILLRLRRERGDR